MFRRMFELAWWLAVLCFSAAAAFGQAPSAAIAAQPCDKVCQQQRLDGLFKAMDAAESSRRPKPSDSKECAAYDGREHSEAIIDVCAKLKYVRTLPVGKDTHFLCPGDTGQLVGLSAERIRSIWGVPDYEERETRHDESSPNLRWTYFIGSPKPRIKGGGFPELSLYFKDSSKVDSVTCAPSK